MQRPRSLRVPIISFTASSLPPMYTWPMSVKRAIIGTCVVLCLIAYMVMAAGIISLATLAIGLV